MYSNRNKNLLKTDNSNRFNLKPLDAAGTTSNRKMLLEALNNLQAATLKNQEQIRFHTESLYEINNFEEKTEEKMEKYKANFLKLDERIKKLQGTQVMIHKAL